MTTNVRGNNTTGRNTKIRTDNEKGKDRKKRILEYCTYKRKAKKTILASSNYLWNDKHVKQLTTKVNI
jgi:hypothetical protein